MNICTYIYIYSISKYIGQIIISRHRAEHFPLAALIYIKLEYFIRPQTVHLDRNRLAQSARFGGIDAYSPRSRVEQWAENVYDEWHTNISFQPLGAQHDFIAEALRKETTHVFKKVNGNMDPTVSSMKDARKQLLAWRRLLRRDFDDNVEQQDAVLRTKVQLKAVDRKLACLNSDDKHYQNSLLENEVAEAVTNNQMSEAWRLARLRVGPHLGPNNRRYTRLREIAPTIKQWKECLAQDGPNGGCKAFEVNIKEI